MRIQDGHIYDVAPVAAEERILLLMLPGAKNTPQQLQDNGFIRELRKRELAVDVLALDAHADMYLDRGRVERLLHDTLDDARAHGYRRIWLLGISLGGTGAMLCATQRAAEIEGVFLLAPFLGTRGMSAEVEAAGGFRHWQAGEIGSRDLERALGHHQRGAAQRRNYDANRGLSENEAHGCFQAGVAEPVFKNYCVQKSRAGRARENR